MLGISATNYENRVGDRTLRSACIIVTIVALASRTTTDDEIAEVLVKSDARLSRYAGPSGEAIFPTSANIFTARKSAI